MFTSVYWIILGGLKKKKVFPPQFLINHRATQNVSRWLPDAHPCLPPSGPHTFKFCSTIYLDTSTLSQKSCLITCDLTKKKPRTDTPVQYMENISCRLGNLFFHTKVRLLFATAFLLINQGVSLIRAIPFTSQSTSGVKWLQHSSFPYKRDNFWSWTMNIPNI